MRGCDLIGACAIRHPSLYCPLASAGACRPPASSWKDDNEHSCTTDLHCPDRRRGRRGHPSRHAHRGRRGPGRTDAGPPHFPDHRSRIPAVVGLAGRVRDTAGGWGGGHRCLRGRPYPLPHGSGAGRVEVDRPDRKARRAAGKSDPIDAESAARAALNRVRTGLPKQRDGMVEALRNLRVARRSAVSQRADCMRQIKTLIITAPQELREQLRDLSDTRLPRACAGLRPDLSLVCEPEQATKVALRALGRRHAALTEEIAELEALITPLVEQINPALLALYGVGPDSAGQLLITAGQNTERLHSEGAFAMLCGVAPIPASSGKTNRHRLNRGGDRQANAALYRVVLSRMRWDPRTRYFVATPTTEGLSKKEIIRCLKRLMAREIYYVLHQPTVTLVSGHAR